jgi:AhpD family alkylhydroperoxidase
MEEAVYSVATGELAQRRKELAPETHDAFQAFSRQVFADGALDAKTKQLIAVAVAHVTQCPYCIRGHASAALRKGATERELMEAIWVAAEMRAGGAYAHSTLAVDTAAHTQAHGRGDPLARRYTRGSPPSLSRCTMVAITAKVAAKSTSITGTSTHQLPTAARIATAATITSAATTKASSSSIPRSRSDGPPAPRGGRAMIGDVGRGAAARGDDTTACPSLGRPARPGGVAAARLPRAGAERVGRTGLDWMATVDHLRVPRIIYICTV